MTQETGAVLHNHEWMCSTPSLWGSCAELLLFSSYVSADSKLSFADDQSYDDITSMLSTSGHPGAENLPEDEAWEGTCLLDHPATSPITKQHPNDTADSTAALPGAEIGSPQGDAQDEPAAIDLPSTADLPSLAKTGQSVSNVDHATESEADLFARLTALKNKGPKNNGSADTASTLDDRFDALKGPKPAIPDLADLHKRLDTLKGRDQQLPSMPELEGRFAKLQALSAKSETNLHTTAGGQAVPDFDPDVELDQQQLEALANLPHVSGSPDASNDVDSEDNLSKYVTATASLRADLDKQLQQNRQEQKHQQNQQPKERNRQQRQPFSKYPPLRHASFHEAIASDVRETETPRAARPDPKQVLQSLDLQDDLSEQQLQALANMGDSTDAVPAWAAAAGLSAQDLIPSNDAGETAQQTQHRRRSSHNGR